MKGLVLIYIIYSDTAVPIFRAQHIDSQRGAVVEWLERLGYGEESRRQVVSSRLGSSMRRLQNSLCQPSGK